VIDAAAAPCEATTAGAGPPHPVFERFEMLRIRSQGDDLYLLSDRDDRPVGWLRDRTIHFAGFESYADAIAAAIHGGNALAAYLGGTSVLGRVCDARPPDGSGSSRVAPKLVLRDVRLTHDGAHEWVIVGGRQVARVVPPTAARAEPGPGHPGERSEHDPATCSAGTYAIEFVMADGVRASACLAVAQALEAAVAYHRPGRRCAAERRASWPLRGPRRTETRSVDVPGVRRPVA
jgi:hypothetical protein